MPHLLALRTQTSALRSPTAVSIGVIMQTPPGAMRPDLAPRTSASPSRLDFVCNTSIHQPAPDKRRRPPTPGRSDRGRPHAGSAIHAGPRWETEMAKNELTKIQCVILGSAGRSANLIAWPLPKRLKLSPGSAGVVVRTLMQKGFLERRPALGADPVWKEECGKGVTLVITRLAWLHAASGQPDEPTLTASVATKQAVVAAASLKSRRCRGRARNWRCWWAAGPGRGRDGRGNGRRDGMARALVRGVISGC